MDAIVKFLEKHQPLFDKISRNIYLVAIKDGFLSNMPIVLFSSLFLLNMDEGRIQQLAFSKADSRYLIADSSRIGRRYFCPPPAGAGVPL